VTVFDGLTFVGFVVLSPPLLSNYY